MRTVAQGGSDLLHGGGNDPRPSNSVLYLFLVYSTLYFDFTTSQTEMSRFLLHYCYFTALVRTDFAYLGFTYKKQDPSHEVRSAANSCSNFKYDFKCRTFTRDTAF